MNDNELIAWQVVGDFSDYVHFTCLNKKTAEYLRDWMQACEEDIWRNTAKLCNTEYRSPNGHEQYFSIQECEVIVG